MVSSLLWLSALSLIPASFAFSNTHPLVAWSSKSSPVLDVELLPSSDLLDKLAFSGDVCAHDAVVLIGHPGLHASDLRSLSPHSSLSTLLSSAPSSLQLPYVPAHSFNAADRIPELAAAVASRCGSKLIQSAPGRVHENIESDKDKHVVCLNMPHMEVAKGSSRKAAMAEHENQLSSDITFLSTLFPNHLVIYTGLPSPASRTLSRRQSEPGNGTVTLPDGGILKRYQLLTPGLIVTLLVTFFVLVPIIFLGINALASIQNPIRLDSTKFDAVQKKNQ
ncbi:hypothetical protein K474DRAFT_1655066 [Panus rudis PR-1116 ss-1]|nr:hypothetical protein K474DRAFT_1655066 [Panus rudis PR-1116 ss-1]